MNNWYLCVLLLAVSLVCSSNSYCQIDSNFTVVRKSKTATIPFKVFSKPEHFKNIKKIPLPIYGFDSNELNRIQVLYSLLVSKEGLTDTIRVVDMQKDSLYNAKIFYYKENDSISNLRVGNYKEAYNSLLIYNKQLNDYVKECEATALKQRTRSNINSTLFGILGGLVTGVIIGVIIR